MNSILSLFKWKLFSLFSKRNSISSNLIDWHLDKMSSVGKKVRAYHITMGKYSYVSRNTLIQNTVIGSFCSISEGCNIGMPSHPASFASTSPVFLRGRNCLRINFANIDYVDCPVTHIGNDVWIGAHAQIKSGIIVGNGAIIGAGAVVTKDIPPYAIVGGVPARIIRFRFDEAAVQRLNDSKWWDLPDKVLLEIGNDIANQDVFVNRAASENQRNI